MNVPSDAASAPRAPTASSARGNARFLPGLLLAGRYRIVGLLGKGGMGEVYRADDLKLGQPVALKFLPPGFDKDTERLQRFLGEVRTARQVSHASVCRVYDAGEADGQHFLSMEYVDGEDLASLLRRIGHLPKEKAIQIARQLCAGLAAAHELGILHRDLKPANIMIDGRGSARITDFGLAALAEEIGGEEVGAGTPAYMAPEQLAGREVSIRSDLYSLGLVLYELFTGKPAFQASSVGELRRLQSETTPTSPSSFLEGFDPTVERVILRCLDADPSRRPASALSVAAALPGGDPLAAALAAGETPSPEMVAEAGAKGAVSPAVAWGSLGLFLVALVAFIALAPNASLVTIVSLAKPPAFLAERAREILAQAGHDRSPADSSISLSANGAYVEELLHREGTEAGRWEVLRSAPPGGMLFWYREGPEPLIPFSGGSLGNWMVDPPVNSPGMARVSLDPDGRLVSLLVVPGEHVVSAAGDASEPDYGVLLRATGVDESTLVPVPPEWAPPVFADHRAAWTGSWPGKPEIPLRIEAASAAGRPVSLRIVGPWTRPAEETTTPKASASRLVSTAAYIMVVIVAGIVAVRNVRRGRGDRRGALRLALYIGALRMLWYLGAHHVASPSELDTFVSHLSFAMQRVGLSYVFYLAVEPYARRLWPRMLVSWVRVLEGRFRDPLVGRDLLIGCAGGAGVALVLRTLIWIPQVFGGTPKLPACTFWTLEALRGAVPAFVSIIGIHTVQLFEIIFPVTLLLSFRLLLRRTSLAIAVVTLVGGVLFYPDSGSIPLYLAAFAMAAMIWWLVLFRVGLLAFATAASVAWLLAELPLAFSPPDWYRGVVLLSLATILAPALYGFWTSQAGRPLFQDGILEPAVRR